MNFQRVNEEFNKRAKEVREEIEVNWKRVQPRFEKLQTRFDEFVDTDALLENARIRDIREKLNENSNEWFSRASEWAETRYYEVLDRMGVATKDDVEAMRKKLMALQRKVNKMNKSLR